ncbi:MAG: membrane integrity-associated transporter subunit PqiC [Lautropia sp.]
MTAIPDRPIPPHPVAARPRTAAARLRRRFAGAVFGLALLGGCATPVTIRYYTLAVPEALADTGTTAGGRAAPASSPAERSRPGTIQIDVATVAVPERLARPQLVVRHAGDPATARIDVLDQTRWSSSFDSELRDAFGAALAARTGGVDVTRGGRLPGQPVYRVSLQLRRFDAVVNQRVDAAFGWTLTRLDDGRGSSCESSHGEAIAAPAAAGVGTPAAGSSRRDGPDYDALVQAMRRIVGQAADRIARQLVALQTTGSARCD